MGNVWDGGEGGCRLGYFLLVLLLDLGLIFRSHEALGVSQDIRHPLDSRFPSE